MFSTGKLVREGMGEAEAETAALEEAKLFRQKLLDQGVLSEPVQEDRPQSDVVGVSWQKEVQKWKVEIDTHGRKSYIGCFAEKGEAERRAKELHGTNEMVAVGHYSELPKVRPKSPCPGVCWIRRDQCWWAAVGSQGMRKHFRAKPKDFSEAELERSFEEVVSWLKAQKSTEEATSTAPKTFKRKRRRSDDGGGDQQEGPVSCHLPQFHPPVACPGIHWMRSEQCWKAEYRSKSLRLKMRSRPINHSEEELERSFQEAFTWLERQKSQLLEAPKVEIAISYQGHMHKGHKGVCWAHREGCWKAQCQIKGSYRQFKVKPKSRSQEALEKSFQQVVTWLQDQRAGSQRRATDLAMPVAKRKRKPRRKLESFKAKQPERGVCWARPQQCWIARITDAFGRKRFCRVRPKDHSEEKVEEAFKACAGWLRRQREQKQKDRDQSCKETKKGQPKNQSEKRHCPAVRSEAIRELKR